MDHINEVIGVVVVHGIWGQNSGWLFLCTLDGRG